MQAKNIPYIISYAITILFFLIGVIFFRQSFLALFLILLIIVPIISIALFKLNIRHLSFSAVAKTGSVTAEHDILIEISLKNDGLIPFLNSDISFRYGNFFYPNPSDNSISLPGVPKKTTTMVLPFATRLLGMNEFIFSKLTVTDFMHFYTVEIPMNIYIEVPVLPEDKKLNDIVIPQFFGDDEDDNYVAFGQLTRDIKETREYQPGDSLKDVHWKLSAKSDNLSVKVYEQSTGRTIILLPEMCTDTLQDTVQTLYSYSQQLTKKREFHTVAIATPDGITSKSIYTEDDVNQAILLLYHSMSYEMNRYAFNMFYTFNDESKNIIYIKGKEIHFIMGKYGEDTIMNSDEEQV